MSQMMSLGYIAQDQNHELDSVAFEAAASRHAQPRIVSRSLRLSRDRGNLLGFAMSQALSTGYRDLVARREEFAGIIQEVCPRVAQACRSLTRSDGPSAVFLEGLPHAPTLRAAKAYALGFSAFTGEAFQYTTQNGGEICALLHPVDGAPENSNAFRGEFGPHSDDPNIPKPFRVEVISLFGVLNELDAATGYAALGHIVPLLKSKTIEQLKEFQFRFRTPPSFGNEIQWSAPRPVLFQGAHGQLCIQCDSHDTRGQTLEARRALRELEAVARSVTRKFVVRDGSALLFRNDDGLHSRDPIAGKREVIRIYTSSSLAALRVCCGTNGRVFDVRHAI